MARMMNLLLEGSRPGWRRARAGLAALAAVFLAAGPARADLVWTAEGGWQVQGGVLAPFFGQVGETASALEAMNKAKTAQEAGSYWTALSLYSKVVQDYPSSIFAPEALYQKGIIYIKRHQWDRAYTSFDQIVTKYPDYPRFNTVIGQEYNVAHLIQQGKRPYMWGLFPWFTDYSKAVDYYNGVVQNAPYSEYAPLALMNIATVAQKHLGKPEVAIDALDRLVNNYPESMLAPDAYLQMAATYSELVIGPPYDQGSTRDAIRFYQDYLYLFKDSPDAASAQTKLDNMVDIYSRSKLILGDFYYYYRNSDRAALIFYNEAVTLAPTSRSATQARAQIAKIRRGVPPPLTPYDWIFGRYKEPGLLTYEEESFQQNLSSETFQEQATEAFAESPGDEAVETVSASGQVQQYEGLATPLPSGPLVPPEEGFLTPVEQPQGSGPPPGQEPGGHALLR
jgi:outer membrane protein assembly factor BamD